MASWLLEVVVTNVLEGIILFITLAITQRSHGFLLENTLGWQLMYVGGVHPEVPREQPAYLLQKENV